jgi:hypothetical protein
MSEPEPEPQALGADILTESRSPFYWPFRRASICQDKRFEAGPKKNTMSSLKEGLEKRGSISGKDQHRSCKTRCPIDSKGIEEKEDFKASGCEGPMI